MKKLIEFSCKKCGKITKRYANKSKKYDLTYCSRYCADNKKGTVVERFFKSISDKKHDNDCWEWSRIKTEDGYGTISINDYPVRAHRYSWELHHGPIPSGMIVCHKCDNRSCVNPEHLYVGTHTDNNTDTVERKRNPYRKGSKHPCSILTEEVVLDIREKLNMGYTGRQLSEIYGVSEPTISMIKSRKNWGHI